MKRGLADGAAINSRNRLGESALIVVLKKNRVDLAQFLIDAGADINQPALNGINALMAAAYEGQTEMVRQLLAKGANPAALDRLQKNAMIYAAGEGHTQVVTLLLASGIDPNAVYNNDLTALMWAAGSARRTRCRPCWRRVRNRNSKTIAARPRPTSRANRISPRPRSCWTARKPATEPSRFAVIVRG